MFLRSLLSADLVRGLRTQICENLRKSADKNGKSEPVEARHLACSILR